MKKFVPLAMICCWAAFLFTSCEQEAPITLPTYSSITVSPQQEVYHVGDEVTCSIELLTPGSDVLDTAVYWFYANWWFNDPELTADFQVFKDEDGHMIARSSKIELTEAAKAKTDQYGQAELCFYGRLEYPAWDFRKIEIRVPIKVVE